ncbi:cytochrome P450 [Suillus subalutaceus]|uniref:cytochrome P450 n=1 Tax=Suillus subalutaceus TaxID=48586 RepID=UPI001B872BA7|nr:cytochrome P450 [Suillus subalutaceus]KAG1842153.1 cytochrome P450 [Suillus subalutaceus]
MADLIGRQNNVGFTYYGNKLRASRKLLHASLGTGARNEWNPMLVEECKHVMKLLVDHPEHWMSHVKSHVASLVLRFTYGRKLSEDYVRMAEEINFDTGMALQPGWIVDSLPFLKYLPTWLPGMHFKRWALTARSRFERCTQEPYTATRLAVLNGTAPPSFVARHLTSMVNCLSPFEEQVLMHTAGSVYGAATDTTSAFLMSFILLMVVFQDIQEKAHAELVNLVGHHRLPTVDDQASLPYIEALIKEIHRFNPVINLVPHSPMEEDEYEGYRIPRKSWIMCNVWSMTHDPEIYQDAEVFNPDRHLSGTVKDPRQFTFGFGRRSCPGVHFANAETFMFITHALLLFKISPATNVNEAETHPPLSYTSTFTSQPTPFDCLFELRDPILKEFLCV